MLCMTISSVQLLSQVMSDHLWPHGLQHARLPCPSPTNRECSNSCPSSWWCHPTISSSVFPFSLCLHLSQNQGLFQGVSSLHQVAKGLGVSATASVLPMNIQNWSPLGWTDWISLQSKGLSRVFSNTQFKSINSTTVWVRLMKTHILQSNAVHFVAAWLSLLASVCLEHLFNLHLMSPLWAPCALDAK